ncbi:hypothetical protein MSAN_00577300 [Mycena sanguinolenta]|uniref:Cellobiose dehydrogenase cytochrome domain-containing protein n=1 Tax=Mycena sanguinolenta TaxID=230812 RepID=A0A8H6Z9Y3_9AGAR|nr:hypothetical protein MSAN_00577300 [Mycena sanguinolenta]
MLILTFIATVTALCKTTFGAATTLNSTISPSPDIVPISIVASMAAIQLPGLGGDTRIFYQVPDGSIWIAASTGPFSIGTFYANNILVPAGQAELGTPLAVTSIGDVDYQEIHLFFISPSSILSEWIFQGGVGWRGPGGLACSDCINNQNFVVQSGRVPFYAMLNTNADSPATLRVGFISSGAPTGLTEADFDPVHGWRLGQLNS